jgi:hypothetical protein
MPTPDASQYTQLKKYTAISETGITSSGEKQANLFNTLRTPPSRLSANALFLPSINKNSKLALVPTTEPPLPEGYAGALQFITSTNPSYLQVSPKASLFPGTQSFTISFYLNFSSAGGADSPYVFALRKGTDPSVTNILGLQISGLDKYFRLVKDGSTVVIGFDYTPYYNSWHFVNIYGTSGTSVNVEIDGVLKGTSSSAYNIVNPNDPTCYLYIGAWPRAFMASGAMQGYLADFRWVVGSGLSLIPKPSPPLPVIPSKTSLLLLSLSQANALKDYGTDAANTTLTVVGPSPPPWSSQLVV